MSEKSPYAYAQPASVPEIRNPKRIDFALSDSQILRLLDDIKDEKWKFAVQLCAVYGLRAEELRNLRIKDRVEEKDLWSIYQKSKGGEALRTHLRRKNVWNVLCKEAQMIGEVLVLIHSDIVMQRLLMLQVFL